MTPSALTRPDGRRTVRRMRIRVVVTVVSLALIVAGCVMIERFASGTGSIAMDGNALTGTFLIRSFQSPGGMLLIWLGTLGLAGVAGQLVSRRR
jgi:hypothetical protein